MLSNYPPLGGNAPATKVFPQFGDGSDGALNFDGNSAVTGSNRVGTVYTLSRDIFATVMYVAAGVTIQTNGFIIYANASILSVGSILNNGISAVPASNNGAVAGPIGTVRSGSAGGGPSGNANAGSIGTAVINSIGGAGGQGGTSSGGVGGLGGTVTALANARITSAYPLGPPMSGSVTTAGVSGLLQGGSGGGSGGGDGINSVGGAGGSGGGVIILSAPAITNNGVISAIGGDGTINGGITNRGGGAGGGGGGILTYTTSAIVNNGTMTVAGGNGAAGGNGGGNGTNGSVGKIISTVLA